MSTNQHIQKVLGSQETRIWNAFLECYEKWGSSITTNEPYKYNNTLMCPPFFDELLCWAPQLPNTVHSVPCPSYILGFSTESNATRFCTSSATWYSKPGYPPNQTFTNYSACGKTGAEVKIHDFSGGLSNITIKQPWLSFESMHGLKTLSDTGYAVSLISLLVAFTIMFTIRRLHCARNILHMNLFASFILRAFIHILTSLLFVDGLGLAKDIEIVDGERTFKTDSTTNNFECKLIVTLSQYFTTANYSWILMEGLYLNNLILRALFTDSSRNLVLYISLGWGLPVLVIIPWVVMRILWADILCWTTDENGVMHAILMVPIMVSVVLNSILFISISVVLYKKLKSPGNEDGRRYLKWAKSTLVLVPLFGVNYTILFVLYLSGREYEWLICDRFFGSFQGFFVAVLYCFLNGEVKSEVKPYLKRMMTFLATNNVTRVCFPCGEKYVSRSAVGRQSVCTTLSCSSHSLYNNGVGTRRNSKTKFDILAKVMIPNITEKQKDICMYNGVKKCSHHITASKYPGHVPNNLETCLCHDSRPQNHLPICEEEIAMLEEKNSIMA